MGTHSRRSHALAGRRGMQDVDCVAEVKSISEPARLRRSCVDVNTIGDVSFAKHRRGVARHRCWRRDLSDDSSVGPPEVELAVWLSLHLKSFFVDRAVVSATEHREIRQRRRTAVRPVTDVMPLPEPSAAARETTALITMLERAP